MLGISNLKKLSDRLNVGIAGKKETVRVSYDSNVYLIVRRLYDYGYLTGYFLEGDTLLLKLNRDAVFKLDYLKRSGIKNTITWEDLSKLTAFERKMVILNTSSGLRFGDELSNCGGDVLLRILRRWKW